MKPTKAQETCLELFALSEPRTAYRTGSIASLRALVTKGYLVDVTPPGPGGIFSPSIHYKFKLTDKGRKWVADNVF